MAALIDRAQLQARLDEYLARAAAGERILVRDEDGRTVVLGPGQEPAADSETTGPVARRRHHSTRTIADVLAEDRGV